MSPWELGRAGEALGLARATSKSLLELTMDYRQRIYKQYASHYALTRDVSLAAVERQLPVLKARFGRFLPKDRAAQILDIGCGYGGFLLFLAREGYTQATGIDVSSEQLELARSLGVQNVQCAELMEFLPKHPAAFDVIVALDVVEHFPKEHILPLLDSIHLALRPGGVLIVQSPNGDGPFAGRYRYSDFSHTLAFTPESVLQVLSASGFEQVRIYPVEPVIHGPMSFVRFLIWKGIRTSLQFYLAVETGSPRGHVLTQNLVAVGKKAMSITDRDDKGISR